MKQQYEMPTGEIVEKEMPQWKTPWNHDRDFESERTGMYSDEPSATRQEFKDDADMNNIITRFMQGAGTPEVVLPEHFADLSGRTTYFDMASKAAEANELFYLLPANKRAEFLNDPTRWADEVVRQVNLGNLKALAELGITATEKPQEPPLETPGRGGTPAPLSPPATSEALQLGGNPPNPPSDNGK